VGGRVVKKSMTVGWGGLVGGKDDAFQNDTPSRSTNGVV